MISLSKNINKTFFPVFFLNTTQLLYVPHFPQEWLYMQTVPDWS